MKKIGEYLLCLAMNNNDESSPITSMLNKLTKFCDQITETQLGHLYINNDQLNDGFRSLTISLLKLFTYNIDREDEIIKYCF